MQPLVSQIWKWAQAAFPSAFVAIEVAMVGLFVSWLQLRYVRLRDKNLDTRNGWTDMHKAMLAFRFKREMLNQSPGVYPEIRDAMVAVSESLHNLRGQLDRMPDSPLVEQISEFPECKREAGRMEVANVYHAI